MKWNPCLGWEIFKIASKQMRDICYLKFGNTVKTGNCLNIVFSYPNDQLYCGFVSCMCFKVWVPFYCGHSVVKFASLSALICSYSNCCKEFLSYSILTSDGQRTADRTVPCIIFPCMFLKWEFSHFFHSLNCTTEETYFVR
jgi:hypothetical protein